MRSEANLLVAVASGPGSRAAASIQSLRLMAASCHHYSLACAATKAYAAPDSLVQNVTVAAEYVHMQAHSRWLWCARAPCPHPVCSLFSLICRTPLFCCGKSKSESCQTHYRPIQSLVDAHTQTLRSKTQHSTKLKVDEVTRF
jgi:hypothetical protein